MDWDEFLQRLFCLILYRPLIPELVDTDIETFNERQKFTPILDSCLSDNTLATNFSSGVVGRIRGQAFGCSNLFENKRGAVGARFRKTFALSPDDVVAGETYEFRIAVDVRGRFEHFPTEVPGGLPLPRQPPADTLGQIDTVIRVTQGNSMLADTQQFFHLNRVHTAEAGIILNETINRVNTVRASFTPTGDSPIFFEVTTSVAAAARGGFSSIKLGAIASIDDDALEVRTAEAVVQKVAGEDVCAELFEL